MKEKKPNKEKMKNTYIFGDRIAKAMSKITFRAQLESAMLSQALLLIGMTLMIVFNVLFSDAGLASKIMVTFNLLCAFVLIGSYLVTSFDQYQSYTNAAGIDTNEEKKKIQKRGSIFKRISLAKRNKRIQKHSPAPKLVASALDNMKTYHREHATDEEIEEIAKQMEEGEEEKQKKDFIELEGGKNNGN